MLPRADMTTARLLTTARLRTTLHEQAFASGLIETVIGPSFAVDVHGSSNLRAFQGIDLSSMAAGLLVGGLSGGLAFGAGQSEAEKKHEQAMKHAQAMKHEEAMKKQEAASHEAAMSAAELTG